MVFFKYINVEIMNLGILLFFFYREFQPMTSTLNDSSLSLEQNTNLLSYD